MNIALFGGSFDPPHLGHIAIVEAALKQLDIKKVIVVPAYLNPFKKKSHADAKQRLQWLKAIFKDNPRVEVSPFEVNQNRSVATVETVKHFKKDVSRIFLIVGADNLKKLHLWHQYQTLDHLVTWVVAARPGYQTDTHHQILEVAHDISSTELRNLKRQNQLIPSFKDEIINYYKREKMNERITKISSILDDNKAEAIESFDLSDKDYFVDAVVIASSLGTRHTEALLDHLKKGLKPQEEFLAVDASGDWIVIDLGDILIHIMTAEFRAKYDMENFLSELEKEKR